MHTPARTCRSGISGCGGIEAWLHPFSTQSSLRLRLLPNIRKIPRPCGGGWVFSSVRISFLPKYRPTETPNTEGAFATLSKSAKPQISMANGKHLFRPALRVRPPALSTSSTRKAVFGGFLMKHSLVLSFVALTLVAANAETPQKAKPESLQAWRDARYGSRR